MPRKKRRFSRLNSELKANKGVADPNSRVGKYLDFLTGKTPYKVSTAAMDAIKAAGGRSGSYGVALKPFNIATPADATTTYFASFTKYSKSVLTPLALQEECGHNKIDTAKTIDDYTYNPAIVIAHIRDTTATPTEPASQITGEPYKKYPGKSGTIPFGCKTEYGEKEDVRKKAVLAEAKAKKAYTASYQPEEWNSIRSRMIDVNA